MNRQQFVQAIGATLAMSSIGGCAVHAPTQPTSKRLYIDGLSFIPADHMDIKASELNAFIADI